MTRRFDSIILDASCLLNLYATGHLREIAIALPNQFWVADYVAEREALFVWRRSRTDGKEVREPVDLTSLTEAGLIQLMRLEEPVEEATFVALGAELDDGEAVTGALAFHRGCAVATDDRKARRVLGQLSPPVELVSTLEILKRWAEESRIPGDELSAALAEMQSSASYIPGVRHPLYQWWLSVVDRSGS